MHTRRLRTPIIAGVDALVWLVAILGALWLRFDFDADRIVWSAAITEGVTAVSLHVLFGSAIGVYLRRWKYGGFGEVVALALTGCATGLVLQVMALLDIIKDVPRTVPMIATGLFITGAVAMRATWRLVRQAASRPQLATPLVVVGAGEAADIIVQRLLANPGSPYRPVALVDDDPAKSRSRLHGVRVQGRLNDLESVTRRLGVHHVLFAIPSASRDVLKSIDDVCQTHDLNLLVLPSVNDIFLDPQISDIRAVTEVDLLGRREITIDPEVVAEFINGKRVLITGAGGSIGSELCRQVSRFSPAELVMLDRDESGLHGVQLSIEGRALLNNPNLVLADIRDAERINEVFGAFRPDIVFHAAALKHLPLLEAAPAEAWKTNVVGTNNLLQAAHNHDVSHFVNISTDKAANPSSVLGSSKRLTERLTSHLDAIAKGSYKSVRFGNVLGSRGSVLTAFRSQAANGGPLTVTHPDVTRYFMTVEEAVGLTLYAAAVGAGGEVLILDMGEPVRIADVARRFANQYTPPLDITYTGLRPGEKLQEVLLADSEIAHSKVHPLIRHATVPPLSMATLDRLAVEAFDHNSEFWRSACSLEPPKVNS